MIISRLHVRLISMINWIIRETVVCSIKVTLGRFHETFFQPSIEFSLTDEVYKAFNIMRNEPGELP